MAVAAHAGGRTGPPLSAGPPRVGVDTLHSDAVGNLIGQVRGDRIGDVVFVVAGLTMTLAGGGCMSVVEPVAVTCPQAPDW